MAATAAALLAALWAAPLAAQTAIQPATQTATSKSASATAPAHLEVAFTYNATLSDVITGTRFWMQGGSAELEGRFYRGLGVVASVAGMHADNINTSGVGLDLVTAVFGPRYTWSPAHKKYSLFAQAQAGEAFGFDSVFPAATGATGDSYNLAVQAGGGLDLGLTPHLALRAFEANWLRTQLPNSTNNVQNNLRLGAGLVLRFR